MCIAVRHVLGLCLLLLAGQTCAQTVGTTTSLDPGNISVTPGSSISLTAEVTPAVSTYGLPTGTVTFSNGTTTLGTGVLNNGILGTTQQSGALATFTTAPLQAGTYTFTATYAATGLFAGSSGELTEIVAPTGFTASVNPTSLTITAGDAGAVSVMAQGIGNFTGTISLGCGRLPTHVSCSFEASTIYVQNNLMVAPGPLLTIATNSTAALSVPDRPGAARPPQIFLAVLFFPALGGLLWGTKCRRTLPSLTSLAALLMMFTGGLAGCGGGDANIAAKGTYRVPVTFTTTGGLAAQTVNLSVTVQ